MQKSVKRYGLSLLSVILSLLMVVYLIPTSVFASFAEGADEAAQQENFTDDYSRTSSPFMTDEEYNADAEYENEDLRQSNVKYFVMDDGSYTMAVYPGAVHTRNSDGKWIDIDNTLKESGKEFTTADAKIKFVKKTTGNESIFTLHDGNKKITMSLIGAKKGVTGLIKNLRTNFDDKATELQKMTTLDKLSSQIIYKDILDGIDLEYVLKGTDVKENIIIKEKKTEYSFAFEMKLNNLTAELTDNSIVLSENGETIYTIPAPFMYDSSGEYSYDVTYSLNEITPGKYILTVIPSSEWINSNKRSFPVIVDPSIVAEIDMSVELVEATVNSGLTAGRESNCVKVGYRDGNRFESYIGIKQININNPNSILEAELTYTIQSCYVNSVYGSPTEPFTVFMGAVEEWDKDTITWNNKPAKKGDYTASSSTSSTVCSWDITEILQTAVGENSDCYLCLESDKDYSVGDDRIWKAFYSSTSVNTPVLTVKYDNFIGVEKYWSTTDHSAGFAGSGYVNNKTGGLTFVINTLTTTDYLNPVNFSLVYNSEHANTLLSSSTYENLPYSGPMAGKGFKLGIIETLKPYDINGTRHYMMVDSDGTEHLFVPTETENQFKDQDGLGLTLTIDLPNYSYRYTDSDGTLYTYHLSREGDNIYGGALVGITSTSGNVLMIDVMGNSLRPERIRLRPNGVSEPILQLFAYYNSYGLISRISNPTTNESYIFYYSSTYNGTSISQSNSGYLRRIIYAKGTSSTSESEWNAFTSTTTGGTITKLAEANYTYNSSGLLTKARDELQDKEIRYTYDSSGRVMAVQEYSGSTAIYVGQKIGFTYKRSSTEVRSSGKDDQYGNSDDLITTYVFDSMGRTVTEYTTNSDSTEFYGGTSGAYTNDEGNAKNNLKSDVVTDGTFHNIIKNGRFLKNQDDIIENWVITGAYGYEGDDYWENQRFYLRSERSGSTVTVSQEVELENDQYTLSFYIDSVYSTNSEFYVKVKRIQNGQTSLCASKEIPLNQLYEAPGDCYKSFTFSILSPGTYIIEFEFIVNSGTGNNPYVYLDEIMLADAEVACEYSYIENGGFESSGNWSLNSGSLEYVSNFDSFKKSLKLGAGKTVEQTIFECPTGYMYSYDNSGINPTQFGVYTVFAWAKKNEAILSNGNFRIKAELSYYTRYDLDDQNISFTVKETTYDFMQDVTEWQYGALTFTVNPEYGMLAKIKIILEYTGSNGFALFDNIVMLKDSESQNLYSYTESGLVSQILNGKQQTWMFYDSQNNNTLTVNSNGLITRNIYDSRKLLTCNIHYGFEGNFYYSYRVQESVGGSQEIYAPCVRGTELNIFQFTEYTYDSYGLNTGIKTYDTDIDVNGIKSSDTSIWFWNNSTGTVTTTDSDSPPIAGSNDYYKGTFATYQTNPASHIFGATLSETTDIEKTTRYFYDESNGYLLAVIYPDSEGVAYEYDIIGNVEFVRPAVISGDTYSAANAGDVEYDYDSSNRLYKIITDSTSYKFTYDNYGNVNSVSNDNDTIVEYSYNTFNGKLSSVEYGNGFFVRYEYDNLDRVTEILYNNEGETDYTVAYKYHYDSRGNVTEVEDLLNDRILLTEYDSAGRLIKTVNVNSDEIESGSRLSYDSYARVSGVEYTYPNTRINNSSLNTYLYSWYRYDLENRITYSSTTHGGSYTDEINTYYTSHGELSSRNYTATVNNSFLGINTQYQFYDKYELKQYNDWLFMERISINRNGHQSLNNYNKTIKYRYYDDGNISRIEDSYSQAVASYKYDNKNQLIREDNLAFGKTYTWEYDGAGNIVNKKTYNLTYGDDLGTVLETNTYTYYSGTDILMAYGNVGINYDEIGNPTTYLGTTLTWENGKGLASYGNYTYEYDLNGVRISKSYTKNGTVYNTAYIVDGSKVMRQSWTAEDGTEYVTDYIYDETGKPRSFGISKNGGAFEYYYFMTSMNGNIIAVLSHGGSVIVEYEYDAWGNIKEIVSDSTVYTAEFQKAVLFRYRGYIYDSESGFYYLNSRYYDPETGRFINMDNIETVTASPMSLTDKNLYAYCDNNPVMRVDKGGEFWDIVFDVVSLAASIYDVCNNPDDPWAWVGLAGDVVDVLVPCVGGVGEITKAVSKGKKAIDAVDNVHDAAKAVDNVIDGVKIQKATNFTADAKKAVKALDHSGGVTRSTAAAGRKIHSGYRFGKHGKEYSQVPGFRMDYLDEKNKVIYELKPNNPQSIAKGIKQLKRYNEALGGGYKLILELY